jgi:nucleoside-diphosphate-sugar epimerase
VDDWAPREKMVRVNVHGLRNLLEAVRGMKLRRFVFIGSIMVYGDGDLVNANESARFVRTGDNYNHTKIECERLLWKFVRETGLPAVVLRPSYIYGERDNQFLPRVCRALLSREWIYVDWGRIPFALSDVRNVVEACVLAASRDSAVGQGFIITDAEPVTRRELVEIVREEMGYKRPFVSFPRGLGITMSPFAAGLAKFMNWERPYLVNRFLCHFAGTRLTFDISKARRLLGYEPTRSPHQSLREAARWFRENRPDLLPEKEKRPT